MSQSPQADIQERIAAARREAESLKEKIRAKRESSADTSCQFTPSIVIACSADVRAPVPNYAEQCEQWQLRWPLYLAS